MIQTLTNKYRIPPDAPYTKSLAIAGLFYVYHSKGNLEPMYLLKLAALFSALLFTLSCSKSFTQTEYLVEANRYCEVHTTAYWNSAIGLEKIKNLDHIEKQEMFSNAIGGSIKSEAMRKLIFEEGAKIERDDFYTYLTIEIPKLTDQPFECPDMADFYVSKRS